MTFLSWYIRWNSSRGRCLNDAASLNKKSTKVLFSPSARRNQQRSSQNSLETASCWSSASSCFIHSNARVPRCWRAANSRLSELDRLAPSTSERKLASSSATYAVLAFDEVPRGHPPQVALSSGASSLGSLGEIEREEYAGWATSVLNRVSPPRILPVLHANVDWWRAMA